MGGGNSFRKLVLFRDVGQQVNKNKQTSRKMGGGTSPTCSVKHKLAPPLPLLKLAASWKSPVNKHLHWKTVLLFSLGLHWFVVQAHFGLSVTWFERKKNEKKSKEESKQKKIKTNVEAEQKQALWLCKQPGG